MSPKAPARRVVYLATHNHHKCRELQALAGDGWEVRPLEELGHEVRWDETGATFAENARLKALAVKPHTAACVLGDDSGLAVAALGGAPGVYSSRYAGPDALDKDNNAKLLGALEKVPEGERTAHFVCVLHFIDESGCESSFTGACRGRISYSHRGSHGFGYDPLFIPDGLSKTMAELTPLEKNAISHRRRAVEAWLAAAAQQARGPIIS